MLIAFVQNQKAFLPELNAYLHFFSKYDISVTVCNSKKLSGIKPDVEWHFMGLDLLNKSTAIKIHDYASSSSSPFMNLKNKLKTLLNTRPGFRLFLNPYVYNKFLIRDEVPFGFRDMGIFNDHLAQSPDTPKEYDFIYLGEMRSRRLNPLIDCFTKGALSTKNILFLSRNYKQIEHSLREYSNILFKGPVPPDEVKKYIRSSKFGINYIPDIEPFNQQTSTKFLEYAAYKIPVVTTRYPWIENFQNKYGGNYFYLRDDLSNFTWEAVNEQNYTFPDLSEWTWEYQIRKSGVLDFLSSKFPGIKWPPLHLRGENC